MEQNQDTTNAPVISTESAPATLVALVYDPAIGIIGHLRSNLWTAQGVSKREMVAKLTVLFPDRDPIGMAVTVGIQLGRLQKKFGKITSYKHATRGRVYGFATHLVPDVSAPVVAEPVVTEPIETPVAPAEDGEPTIEQRAAAMAAAIDAQE